MINVGLKYNYVKSGWKGAGDQTILTDESETTSTFFLFDRLKIQQHEIALMVCTGYLNVDKLSWKRKSSSFTSNLRRCWSKEPNKRNVLFAFMKHG